MAEIIYSSLIWSYSPVQVLPHYGKAVSYTVCCTTLQVQGHRNLGSVFMYGCLVLVVTELG